MAGDHGDVVACWETRWIRGGRTGDVLVRRPTNQGRRGQREVRGRRSGAGRSPARWLTHLHGHGQAVGIIHNQDRGHDDHEANKGSGGGDISRAARFIAQRRVR